MNWEVSDSKQSWPPQSSAELVWGLLNEAQRLHIIGIQNEIKRTWEENGRSGYWHPEKKYWVRELREKTISPNPECKCSPNDYFPSKECQVCK